MLGAGSFTQVIKAREKESGHIVALKQIQVKDCCGLLMCKRELGINEIIDHPGIVAMYGHFFDMLPNTSTSSDSKDKNDDDRSVVYITLFLILEYCPNGSLSSQIKLYQKGSELAARHPISEKCMAQYSADLIDAIKYLHHSGIMHRDIKACNILLSQDFKPKLADFGASIHDPKLRHQTFTGTPFFMAPEITDSYDDDMDYDKKVDSWSLGLSPLGGQVPLLYGY